MVVPKGNEKSRYEDQRDVYRWLDDNREILKDFHTDEIAEMSTLCLPWISADLRFGAIMSWTIERSTGLPSDFREKWQLERKLGYLRYSLLPLWREAAKLDGSDGRLQP